MSDLNLENIVGFKAVDKDGNEQNVTVDEMVDMVSTRMVMALSETSTFAAAAATGNDVYENELPTVTDAANVRVLQSSGDAAKMTMQSLASKLGELMTKSNYIRIENMTMNFPIYKLSFVRNENMVISIIGEGNSNLADNYIIMKNHNGSQLSFLKNNGPKNILLYIDNNNELYIKLNYYSRVIVYFQNKEPQNNALSATEVDIDISTLTQVGI
ncbi:hypothetical protein NCY90_02730 [Phocaeicola vulgatus]|uniref:hypothetical protein n=1 Tax=Phocaeicola vulgatus TaxID=821 RepID=UPI00202E89D0|nr:hypothetical protein [Phocaeicola vulgatus]MCM1750264.1 hypothetical protein [Phocaeicola vulgatus]